MAFKFREKKLNGVEAKLQIRIRATIFPLGSCGLVPGGGGDGQGRRRYRTISPKSLTLCS